MVITKRRGKWVVDYRLNGARKVPSFSTKKEAELFKRELLLRDLDNYTGYKNIIQVQLKQAIRKYVLFVTSKKSNKTQKCEKKYFEVMYELLGNIQVCEVKLEMLESLQMHLSESVSNSTVNRHFNTYRNFLKKCVDWQYLRDNPALKLENLREKKSQKRVWKPEEIKLFLDSSPKWIADPFYLLAVTGIRAGEACRLKWSDVNNERGFFRVTSTKGTGAEREREVPMSEQLQAFFANKNIEAKKCFKAKKGDFVFRNAGGMPLQSNQLSRAVRRLIGRLGLGGLTLHGLRHTFISELAAQNLSVEKIRLLVGHSNLATTQGYLHLDQEHLREAVVLLESHRNITPSGC